VCFIVAGLAYLNLLYFFLHLSQLAADIVMRLGEGGDFYHKC
jgi:hypothetical protein